MTAQLCRSVLYRLKFKKEQNRHDDENERGSEIQLQSQGSKIKKNKMKWTRTSRVLVYYMIFGLYHTTQEMILMRILRKEKKYNFSDN